MFTYWVSDMIAAEAIYAFLIAVLLGFLIGLERERKREVTGSIFAGIRTFPLISLFGASCGVLSSLSSVWLMMVGLLSLSSLLVLAYWRSSSGAKVGGTSEIAALLAFTLGALAGRGDYIVALAGAVLVTTVLSLRDELRLLSGAISRADLFAIVQFAAVSLVIFPLVPNENIGPWGVWNPRNIWLLVVLISGISFVGYVLSKLISTERSIGLSGFIGGIASSTAVTLAFAERSRKYPELSQMLAAGVLAATAVSVLRLAILIGVIQPRLMLVVLPSFLLYFVVCALGGWLMFRSSHKPAIEAAKLDNPFELKTALSFAALFALVLLITKVAQVFLGDQGIFIASTLSGLTQLDAITLTLAQQSQTGLDMTVATKALALALGANSLFKTGLGFSLASKGFAKALGISLIIAAIAALLLAWFLPLDRLLPGV